MLIGRLGTINGLSPEGIVVGEDGNGALLFWDVPEQGCEDSGRTRTRAGMVIAIRVVVVVGLRCHCIRETNARVSRSGSDSGDV